MFAYKVVVIGDFGVGKTSLIHRFVENSFSEEYLSTIGLSISRKQLVSTSGIKSTMMIWDTEGETQYKAIFKQYLIGAKAFIIVADLTRENTIKSIQNHIKLIENVAPNAPICIALNKSDLEQTPKFTPETLKSLSCNILSIYNTFKSATS